MSKSHVTKREAQAVADYASEVITALHMPRWRVLVMDEPGSEDAIASVDWVDGKHTARIWLCSDWMKRDDADRRETITHEVLHLLHGRITDLVIDDSADLMRSTDVHNTWTRQVRREFELMVDHLAMFLANTHSLEQAWATAHGRKR